MSLRAVVHIQGSLWIGCLLALLAAGCASDNKSGDATPNVIEREELGRAGKCLEPGTCTEDYTRFIQVAQEFATPSPEADLILQLSSIDAGSVPLAAPGLSSDALGSVIARQLNMEFLLDGLNARPLEVVTIERRATEGYEETRLLFNDPWVGEFEGLLLTPHGDGPFPAILAIHGHDDTAEIFRDEYHGGEYPGQGYAILMLTMRAMGSGSEALIEHRIALDLILSGFDLMALRVYESLLGFKYLRALPSIDPERIGLIGHSGGSSTGNLTTRIEPRIRAYVSDHQVDYAEWFTELASAGIYFYHCETVPQIYPYHVQITDFSTSLTKVLPVSYGYPNGMAEIFDFFNANVKNAGPL